MLHSSPYPGLGKKNYRADIDGLRAVAAIAVVAFHGFPAIMSGGYIGVSIFFVISGYLISTILFKGFDKNNFDFVDFYIKRIRRIFPSLIVILFFAFFLGWLVLLPDEFILLGKYVAGGSIFIDNFLAWSNAGYFDKNAELKPLLHLWSLGIEEQFYIFWPLTLWLFWRLKINFWVPVALFIAISFGLNLHEISLNPTAAFYAPWTRMWEILSGGLLAYIHLYKSKYSLFTAGSFSILLRFFQRNTVMNISACMGLFILLYGIFAFDKTTVYPGVNALVPIIGALLLIAAGPDTVINKFLLSNKLIIFFGVISYPLYLWHWTLLSFLRLMVGGEPAISLKLLAISLSIIFSWLTYVCIENPIRIGGYRTAKTVLLCFALMSCGTIGCLVYANDGIPSRLAKHYQNISLFNDVKEADEVCKKKYPVANRYCLLSDPDKPATVVLMGDSHANRLFKSLSTYYSSSNENLLQIGEAGCLPFYNIDTSLIKTGSTCSRVIDSQLDFIAKSKSVKTVIFAFYGRYYLTGINLNAPTEIVSRISDVNNTSTLDRTEIYSEGLQRTIKFLTANGKKVLIVIDAPDYSHEPITCIDYSRPYSSYFSIKHSCEKPLSLVLKEDNGYAEITATIAQHSGIKVINLRDALCKDGICKAKRGDLLLYRDKDHLNPLGASIAIDELWPQISK